MDEKNKKVFVAMSGGVDSSVSAALLKKEGYDVTGIFMVNWSKGCNLKEDRRDAMRVCAKLSIPFLTFDFEKEYKKEVIDYMTREYIEGKTPNPDVMCNKKIKFGIFLKQALKMGANFIATGHYVKIKNLKNKKIYKLLQAKDKNKDQSYFLWTLTQDKLKHCLFPIGNYLKPEVRKIAAKFGLQTAQKKDSQGLCFVGKIKFDDFLKNLIAKKKGSKNYCKKGRIIGTSGNILGEHRGLCYYTIGQRSGIGIGGRNDAKEKGESKALYVIEKNLSQNMLIVSEEKNPILYKKELFAENLNWIKGQYPIGSSYGIKAKIRYRALLQKCEIMPTHDSGEIKVVFNKPQRAVASGQSIVFYQGEEMLGGGIISR